MHWTITGTIAFLYLIGLNVVWGFFLPWQHYVLATAEGRSESSFLISYDKLHVS